MDGLHVRSASLMELIGGPETTISHFAPQPCCSLREVLHDGGAPAGIGPRDRRRLLYFGRTVGGLPADAPLRRFLSDLWFRDQRRFRSRRIYESGRRRALLLVIGPRLRLCRI